MNLNPTPGIACGINLNYTFLPAVLKTQGYKTWALGKWHLGFHRNEYTPTFRGFDHYLGYYAGAEEHFTHEKMGFNVNFYDLANNTEAEVAPCLKPVGNASNEYSSYLYANETLRLLDQHNPETDGPIYVYQAWNNVHAPNEAPDNYLNMHNNIQDPNRRGMAGMVSALDDAFQAIVDKLKEKGMYENTLIIFSTDNGGNLGGSGINYPLRGGKYTFWQGGVRGLGFVAGGVVPENLRNTTWSGHMHAADWYTTIASLAGADTSSTGPLPPDGLDISDALLGGGPNTPSPRTEVVLQILSNSSGNIFESPPKWYCASPPVGSDAEERCRAPQTARSVLELHRQVSDPADTPMPFPVVINRWTGENVTLSVGVLIQGQWKLAWGYPGWDPQPKWDGWIRPAEFDNSKASACEFAINVSGDIQCEGLTHIPNVTSAASCQAKCCATVGCTTWQFEDDCFNGLHNINPHCVSPGLRKHNWVGGRNPPSPKPCQDAPCLFDIIADPTEHTDVANDNPEIVQKMQQRLLELLAGEVTITESKLCPEPSGTKEDPRMLKAAEDVGFWVPYLTTSQ
eukprot:INCI1561.3.p1 GENE.INCI1561.3~~INCI1561.3.p1  ORF type:complete len:569 (-),score=75.29 INCI1561.3:29-1735(-)